MAIEKNTQLIHRRLHIGIVTETYPINGVALQTASSVTASAARSRRAAAHHPRNLGKMARRWQRVPPVARSGAPN